MIRIRLFYFYLYLFSCFYSSLPLSYSSFSRSLTKVASSSRELCIRACFMLSNFTYKVCTFLSFAWQWYCSFFNLSFILLSTLFYLFICYQSHICMIFLIISIYLDFFCLQDFYRLLWRFMSIFVVDSFDLECWPACTYTFTFVFISESFVESALFLTNCTFLFGVPPLGVFIEEMTNFFFCWLHNPSFKQVEL